MRGKVCNISQESQTLCRIPLHINTLKLKFCPILLKLSINFNLDTKHSTKVERKIKNLNDNLTKNSKDKNK